MNDPVPGAHFTLSICAQLAACAALGGFGDIAIYQWAKRQGAWWLAVGISSWVVSLLLMGYLFRYSTMPFSLVVVVLIVLHLLIDVAWDATVVGSVLNTWEWVGVLLAVGALCLIQFGKRAT